LSFTVTAVFLTALLVLGVVLANISRMFITFLANTSPRKFRVKRFKK